jgi:tetratricopeptide (TPR) repeat protein
LDSPSVKDRETINNFGQAYFGLARIAIARKKLEEAMGFLEQSLTKNPRNPAALQMLANLRFQQGDYFEGEKCLWNLLPLLPPPQRRTQAEQFGGQFEAGGKHKEAALAWNFLAWVFATSPEPQILDPEEAMRLAQQIVKMTNGQNPLVIDTLAAVHAAGGQYNQAVQTAQAAINLANSQGNRPLAEVISRHLQFYQQGKPYRCDPNGSDWPRAGGK